MYYQSMQPFKIDSVSNSNRLTLSQAIKDGRLQDFIAQQETRGVPPADGGEVMKVIASAIKQPRLEDQTLRSPSRDGSNEK